jgi:PleD family two-component response regulator
MHEWTGQMRSRLRATDLAGQLTSGSVGILLLDTPVERARVVAQRVKESIGSLQESGAPEAISIGLAGRSAGSTSTGSLLSEAEARAAIDGPDPQSAGSFRAP